MRHFGFGVIAALGACCSVGMAGAQGLTDPTRPPDAAVPMGAAVPAGDISEATGAPVLQSVLQSRDRRYAMISGKTYSVGQSVGGARITAISEGEVTLHDSNGKTVLKLYPDVKKTPVQEKAAQKVPARKAPSAARAKKAEATKKKESGS